MKLSTIVPYEAIIAELKSTDKESVLTEMTETLAAAGRIAKSSVKSVVKALMSREELGSTGIGRGVAVPHAKHESVTGLVAAFGRSKPGIEFAALDGQPVHLVFLLLSSKDSSGQHLEALARIARLARNDRFCRFLREAKDAKELAEIMQEADAELDTTGAGT